MLTKEILQTIQLANENCQPDEAWEMIDTLIDERISQHNIQMLRNWEGNHHFDSKPFDQKISDMKSQRKEIKSLIAQAKAQGYNIEVKAHIEVKMVKKPFNSSVKVNISQN